MTLATYVAGVDRIGVPIRFGTAANHGQQIAAAQPCAGPLGSCSSVGSLRKAVNRLTLRQRPQMRLYRVTDQLHQGRTVAVPGDQIAPTVSGWLAELGAHSTLVEDLARAARAGNWPAAHAVGEQLSVDVTVAA